MAGRNQRHIPQFVQRSFGVPRSGKPKEIWTYPKSGAPELGLIKRTAADHDFYSPPSSDGAATLDDKITDIETQLARKYAEVRALAPTSPVGASIASELLSHLSPRTAHIRLAFAKGFQTMLGGISDVIGNKANLEHALGLNAPEPSPRFNEHIAPMLRDPRLVWLGLPEPLMRQVFFRLAKENFDRIYETRSDDLGAELDAWGSRVEGEAKRGHNDALRRIVDEDVRRSDLESLSWSVQPPSVGGAILPDCVAIALLADGSPLPFLLASKRDIRAILMPLSTNLVLIGHNMDAAPPELENFNAHAASASHDFFLAAREGDDLKALTSLIGSRSTTVIEDVLDRVLGEFRAPVPLAPAADTIPLESSEPAEPASDSFEYSITLRHFGDKALLVKVASRMREIVSALSRVLPLDCLDGITFANDMGAALAAIDVGVDGARTPTLDNTDLGEVVAKTVLVMRDGAVKSHIVFFGGLTAPLIDEENTAADFVYAVVSQFAQAAGSAWFDQCFPGILLRPASEDYDQGLLYHTAAPPESYSAARFSAPFDDGANAAMMRELLSAALTDAKTIIPAARLAYRDHHDLGLLFRTAAASAARIMNFAAKLHGHCDGIDTPSLVGGSDLDKLLEELSLTAWFAAFRQDLEQHWHRRGRWESLEEFYVFNRHLERILWQFGIFCWLPEDGQRRIEVPLIFDAAALIEAAAKAADTQEHNAN